MIKLSENLTPSEWNGLVATDANHPLPSLKSMLNRLTGLLSQGTRGFSPALEAEMSGLVHGVFVRSAANSRNAEYAGQELRGKAFECLGAKLLSELIHAVFGDQADPRKAMAIRMAVMNRVPPGQFTAWLWGLKDPQKALRVHRRLVRQELKTFFAARKSNPSSSETQLLVNGLPRLH